MTAPRTIVPGLILLLVVVAAAGTEADLERLVDIRDQIQQAYYENDSRWLQEMRQEAHTLARQAEDSGLAHYYAALANYRIGQIMTRQEQHGADKYLDDCIERAKTAAKKGARFADAYALRSVCYDLAASAISWKAVQSNRMLDTAYDYEPDNPRVTLVDGISYLERPELFGGDVDKAEASFNKAIQLFEKSHNLRAGWPTWGHAEVYVYLGRVYLDRGDMIRARDAFEKALLLAPDFVWAREWRDELGGQAGLN